MAVPLMPLALVPSLLFLRFRLPNSKAILLALNGISALGKLGVCLTLFFQLLAPATKREEVRLAREPARLERLEALEGLEGDRTPAQLTESSGFTSESTFFKFKRLSVSL